MDIYSILIMSCCIDFPNSPNIFFSMVHRIGKCSRLYPVSVQTYIDKFSPDVQHHRRTSLMSAPLLLQQCPASLVCLILMVLEMGVWGPYSRCFFVGGYCFQDLFSKAHRILGQLPSSFFSMRLVSVHVIQ